MNNQDAMRNIINTEPLYRHLENEVLQFKAKLDKGDIELLPASKIKEMKAHKGVYLIFSNIEDMHSVGRGVKSTYQVGEYELIYIGKAANVKTRLGNHLANGNRFSATVSLPVELIAAADIEEHYGRVNELNYFKNPSISSLEDVPEGMVFRNGVHFEDYPAESFKFVTIETGAAFNGATEEIVKQVFGNPKLSKQ
jgi:hypothetical protein